MKQECAANAKRRNDILLIAILLAVVLVSFLLYTFLVRTDGETVVITVDGEVYGTYPLRKDETVELKIGENQNTVVIKDGTARVESANCPDRICVHHRPISKNGESIVCLPHKLIVTVEGET